MAQYAVVLSEIDSVALLVADVSDSVVKQLVDVYSRLDVFLLTGFFEHTPFAQFAGRDDGDGFGLSYAFVCRKLMDVHPAEFAKAAVVVCQDALHQLHRALTL